MLYTILIRKIQLLLRLVLKATNIGIIFSYFQNYYGASLSVVSTLGAENVD